MCGALQVAASGLTGSVSNMSMPAPGEVPHAGAHVGIDLVDAPQARERKRNGVVAHHLGAVADHVAYGGAILGGGIHVDAVHARAGLRHHLQLRQGGEHLGRIAPVGGDGPVGAVQVLDDLGGRAVAGVVEALELDAGGLHHLPLEGAVAEIEVRHHYERHEISPVQASGGFSDPLRGIAFAIAQVARMRD